MKINKPPYQAGEGYEYKGQLYKVKDCVWVDYDGEDKFEWVVHSFRWIKTTQKWSGKAGTYRVSNLK